MMQKKQNHIAALTGGIASGKSTIARMFRDLGAYVIDADVVARQVVEPGKPAWQQIIEHFGREVLLENQQLDRKKLGTIIFHHPQERTILNQITHPRVIERIDREIQDVQETSPNQVIVVDVPLLIEASMHTAYTTVIVVYVPQDVQLHRLMERDQFSLSEAQHRIQAQMPLSEKVKYATHVIHNDQSLDKTGEQVIAVYQQLYRETPVSQLS